MAELTTSLTKAGYKTLIEGGLVNAVKFYSFGDFNQIYSVTATNNIIPDINGDHNQITDVFCGKAEYNGMFPNTPTTSEIQDARSRVVVEFNRIDCDDEFVTSSLQLQVNINSWINELNSATYSYNMSEKLTQTLWDYVSAKIQTLDLSIKDYKTINQVTNAKFSYVPATEIDIMNYKLISPKYVVANQNQKRLVNKTGNRYNSPFIFTLSTQNVNGDTVHGTNGLFSLVPGNWGYWANGSFVDIETVEKSDLNSWDTLYPAVQIGKSYYYLPNNTVWNTINGLIGYLLQMTNVDGSGENALQALTTQSILFFKSQGTLTQDGRYVIPITFNVNVASNLTNNITEVIGNSVTINFSYDPNDITSNIIEKINY